MVTDCQNGPVAAVVLAAGAGRRVGGPKALLQIDGTTYLERVLATCRTAGCSPIWVAVRPDSPQVLQVLDGSRCEGFTIRMVPNDGPERGMFSSVCAVLAQALAVSSGSVGDSGQRVGSDVHETGFFLLFPVDHPWVSAETVTHLLLAATRSGAAWVRPTFEGQGGHPIVVGRLAAAQLLRQDPRMPLRDALRAGGVEPVSVSVPDSGVIKNVNRPEDLR